MIDDALREMVRHARAYPEHGYNCACRDQWIREARAALTQAQLAELRYLAAVLCR